MDNRDSREDQATLSLTRPEGHTPQGTSRRTLRRRGAIAVATASLAATMAFSAVPTPLYPLYQDAFGVSTLTITVIYAIYAVGVIASLLLVGHLSDVYGRRSLLVPALILNVGSAALFMGAQSLVWLPAARFVCGIAVGMTTATATAYILELGASDPSGTAPRDAPADGGRFSTIAIMANVGGIGLGPLVAGALATVAPHPLRLPFGVFAGVLVVLAVLVLVSPETVRPTVPKPAYRPQRIVVPTESRQLYFAACSLGLAAFSIYGVINALVGTFLAAIGEHSRVTAGAVSFVAFAAGAVVQAVLARREPTGGERLAVVFLVPGLVVVATSVWIGSLPGFVVGALLAGAGSGSLFRVGLGIAASTTSPGTRAEVLAGFFVAAYVGVSVPAMVMGLALQRWTVRAVLPVFALAVIAVVAIGLRLLTSPHHGNRT